MAKERRRGFEISKADRFKQRTRYFTDSGIIGSKEFVRENFLRFKHLFQTGNDRLPKRVIGLAGIYSLKGKLGQANYVIYIDTSHPFLIAVPAFASITNYI